LNGDGAYPYKKGLGNARTNRRISYRSQPRHPWHVRTFYSPIANACTFTLRREGVAAFQLLRHRRNEPNSFLYAFRSAGAERAGPTAGADRAAQGHAGQHPPKDRTWRAPERAPGARLRPDRLPARLQDGVGGDRFEAAGVPLPVRPIAGLAEVQELDAPAVKREAEEGW